MRWSEDSDLFDYSDTDTESTQLTRPSYHDVIRRSSPAQAGMEAGTNTQPHTCAADEQPAEAGMEEEQSRPPCRKTGKCRRKPWCPAHMADPSLDQRRTPAMQCLGPCVADCGHVPANQRLGRFIHNGSRVPVHDRLGPHPPPQGRRRISPSDANGWREVLPRSRSGHNDAPAGGTPSRPARRCRRISDEMSDKCLNCLSLNHRIATYRRPLR